MVLQYSENLKKKVEECWIRLVVSEYQIFLYLTINMLITYPTAILVFGSVSNIRFIYL